METTNTVQEHPRFKFLKAREIQVYQWRKQKLSFKEIAQRLEVSTSRARMIYVRAAAIVDGPPHWSDGLSVRVMNCLSWKDIDTKEKLLEAYLSGDLKPSGQGATRNYGWKSHKEVAAFLGLPEPVRKRLLLDTPRVCPHCGGRLYK